jgi:uncharacterized protein YbjQ (UPF0145 family)
MEAAVIFLALGFPLGMLIVTYFIGSTIERNHYVTIRAREAALRSMPALNLRRVPEGWEIKGAELVSANVVISVDYFKRFLAGLRIIVGGRVTAYEPLLDRARREAVLRLKEEARARGYDALINLRLETSPVASAFGGQEMSGMEVLAYGTALRRT